MPGILPRPTSSFSDRAMQFQNNAINARGSQRQSREEEKKTMGGAIQAAGGGAIAGAAVAQAAGYSGNPYIIGGVGLATLASYYL